MGEYANAFFQGFEAVRGIGDARRKEQARGEVLASMGTLGGTLGEIANTTAVRRQRKSAVSDVAALPIGQDTPLAAIPTVAGAADAMAGNDAVTSPAPAPAPAAALPVTPPTAAPTASPVAPPAPAPAPAATEAVPIVSADSDELDLIKPAALDFSKLGGMMAAADFPPDQAFEAIQQYNSVGNALAAQYLTLASINYGEAAGGNALAALMEANDPDGNYRATYDPNSKSYVVIDLNADDPTADSFVFNQTQVEQFLAQATAGKSPVMAHNKGVIEMAQNAVKNQTAATTADAALVRAGADAKRAENDDARVAETERNNRERTRIEEQKVEARAAEAAAKLGVARSRVDMMAKQAASKFNNLAAPEPVEMMLFWAGDARLKTKPFVDYAGAIAGIMRAEGLDYYGANERLLAGAPRAAPAAK